MGFIRKVGKKIAGAIRKVGRKLKKGLGKVARAFGKLGPLGSIALSFILPGIGGAISNWFGGLDSNGFLVKIVNGLKEKVSWVKEGVATVFNKVTDAIEYGMNAVSSTVGGQGTVGSNFRNWVSNVTDGFIDPSEKVIPSIPEDVTKTAVETVVTDQTVKPDAKPSLLEGKAKDQSVTEYVKGSREADVYKKVEPFRQFGQAINEQEEAVANYNANILARKRDYFSDFGQDILGAGGGQTISTPMNFINVADIFSSDDVAKNYNRAIYGDLMPDDSFVNHNALAMGAINYGTSIYDIMGRD